VDSLVVRGATQHNLKNVSCELPRNRLVVITGPSGSGKSSLAFDTIYAEGQRRYVESLSAYARQFLDQLPKPRVESIEGLSPAIAIEQKGLGKSPRSTVGTVTEIADYLRLLFARVGVPHCPKSGKVLRAYTVQEIVDAIVNRGEGARVALLSPIIRQGVGDLREQLERLRRDGYVRARIDGEVRDLGDEFELDPTAPAEDLARLVRAGNPRPGAWLVYGGKRLKVWRGHVEEDRFVPDEVQPEGKRTMPYDAWLAGHHGAPPFA